MKKDTIDLNELGTNNLVTKIYEMILSTFQEDSRVRFPDDYAAWAVEAMKFFDDPTTASTRYNDSLWQFLVAHGYAGRIWKLFQKVLDAIKDENNETNLALHHLGKVEAKKLLRKEDYAKLVKSN